MIGFIFPGQTVLDQSIEQRLVKSGVDLGLLSDHLLEFNISLSDMVAKAKKNPAQITNAEHSLLVFFSSAQLTSSNSKRRQLEVSACAGYSVGSWTALHYAGCLGFNDTSKVIAHRSEIMERCLPEITTKMIAVIGPSVKRIEEVVGDLGPGVAQISNYNAVGQCTLAVKSSSLEVLLEKLSLLNVKKIQELCLRGPWHTSWMQRAATEFETYLADIELREPRIDIYNNVTGRKFPAQVQTLKSELVKHIYRPVLWENTIRNMIGDGVGRFIEVGAGNLLTNFGFFIDRQNATFENTVA